MIMHNENHTLITISISGDLSQNYDCYVGMATVLCSFASLTLAGWIIMMMMMKNGESNCRVDNYSGVLKHPWIHHC